jgi:ParB/RepB/Spo0J family partition protein
MVEDKDMQAVLSKVQLIDIDSIKRDEVIEKLFPSKKEELEMLKATISKYGIKQPLVINAANGRLVSGYSRLKAAEELGWDKVPCKLVEFRDEEEAIKFAVIDNVVRRQLKTKEKYKLIQKLYGRFSRSREKGFSKTKISKLISREYGFSERTVRLALQWAEIVKEKPEKVKEAPTKVIAKYPRISIPAQYKQKLFKEHKIIEIKPKKVKDKVKLDWAYRDLFSAIDIKRQIAEKGKAIVDIAFDNLDKQTLQVWRDRTGNYWVEKGSL